VACLLFVIPSTSSEFCLFSFVNNLSILF
jgi:hypothetical protein